MMKVKARILTDVEYTLDTTDHDMAKRKLVERLAVDGYVNSDIVELTTTTVPYVSNLDDICFDDIDIALKPECFMYGKL